MFKTAGHNSRMNLPPMISLGILLAVGALVHLFYQGVVTPGATAAIQAYGPGATTNFWVILKDVEQQICITAGIYCLLMMGYKYRQIAFKEDHIYTFNYLELYNKSEAENKDGPIDVPGFLAFLESSNLSSNPSVSTWIDCLRRYKNTNNVQHAADAIRESVEALERSLEAGNSMIRYFIWAIPSIGFIGTVRGIGSALAKAEEAVNGDISGMVDKLGVAFNSTLVSLFISIIVMYVLHVVNNQQDEMVLKTRENCEKNLLSHLHK